MTEKVQLEEILRILRIDADVFTVPLPGQMAAQSMSEDERYSTFNQLMRTHSSNTVNEDLGLQLKITRYIPTIINYYSYFQIVTFLYLPRPPLNDVDNGSYLENLSRLSEGMPPCLLVSGLSKVTTSEL